MSSIVKKVVFGGMAALALVIALSAAPSAKAFVSIGGYGGNYMRGGCCNYGHMGGYFNRGCGDYGFNRCNTGCGYGGASSSCNSSSSIDEVKNVNINYSLTTTNHASSDNNRFSNFMY